jgi:hypothetical protein
VKAAAYRQADGGPNSPELRLLRMIDRFGVAAVMGRPTLYAGEIGKLRMAETIANAYYDRQQSDNWAAWHTSHPELAALLAEAERLANG